MENFDFLRKIIQPIFYVTNDVAKGIGLENLLPNFHIVCLDNHPLVDYLLKAGTKVFCLERGLEQKNIIFRSTSKIIDHPLVLKYITKESKGETANILFFKPSAKIDLICQKYGFRKIGNSVKKNRVFEDKISFYKVCLKEKLPVPEGKLGKFGELGRFGDLVRNYGLPLVIQFGRGWAGSTTFFIDTEKHFSQLKSQFFEKKVKITRYIKGKTILNNACIFKQTTIISPPALQINAVKGFTSTVAGTIGRQWPAKIEKKETEEINKLTKKIGKIMMKLGYKGFFGLDFVIEEKTGKVYISENNARLTASVPFFTKLEIETGKMPLLGFHLLAFLGSNYNYDNWSSLDLFGCEVVARNNESGPVKIDGKIYPGIYAYSGGKLNFLRPEYFAKKLKKNEFWLTTAFKGRIVNPEIEIIRANFKDSVADERGNLKPSVAKLFFKIKEKLKLRKC